MPAAEIAIDEPLVRALLHEQASGLEGAASVRLEKVAEGWDCEIWRLGGDLAIRMPRRALAAPLVLHEQRVLPVVAPLIEAAGVRVPLPLFAGSPGAGYPWAWSVVPWIEGAAGLSVPRAVRSGWAARLSAALRALHVPAPSDHPVNPVRGIPLAMRSPAVAQRIAHLRTAEFDADVLDRAEELWSAGLAARPWDRPPVWLHGDLHPGNLLARGGELVGIIDFGDVTGGDPAYDLAVAWLAFDADGRRDFIAGFHGEIERSTWVRARAWAAAVAVLLVAHSDDNPDYAALGVEALEEVVSAAEA